LNVYRFLPFLNVYNRVSLNFFCTVVLYDYAVMFVLYYVEKDLEFGTMCDLNGVLRNKLV